MSGPARTVHLESIGGIAGDMFAAAFVDAGLVPAERLEAIPASLHLDRIRVHVEKTTRGSVASTRLVVETRPGWSADPGLLANDASHRHTHVRSILDRIQRAEQPPAVKQWAAKVFEILAGAEAQVHGKSVDKVGLHEVGADDAIVDVVAAAVCVQAVSPAAFTASPLRLGSGEVRMAHGVFPVPPPAVAALARGMPVAEPPPGVQPEGEQTTPTGLAILRALEPRFRSTWPAGVVRALGYGAGSRDKGPVPNVFRVVCLEAVEAAESAPVVEELLEIEFYVDDDTPEHLAWVHQSAAAHGAIDAWVWPAMGKKGRLGSIFKAIARRDDLEPLLAFLLSSSTTLGLRVTPTHRHALARSIERTAAGSGPRVKIARDRAGSVAKEKVEFDDLDLGSTEEG